MMPPRVLNSSGRAFSECYPVSGPTSPKTFHYFSVMTLIAVDIRLATVAPSPDTIFFSAKIYHSVWHELQSIFRSDIAENASHYC